MSNKALDSALAVSLVSSGGPGQLHIIFQGSGLKICASREIHNYVTAKSIFEGKAKMMMAREVYGIVDPADMQLSLF